MESLIVRMIPDKGPLPNDRITKLKLYWLEMDPKYNRSDILTDRELIHEAFKQHLEYRDRTAKDKAAWAFVFADKSNYIGAILDDWRLWRDSKGKNGFNWGRFTLFKKGTYIVFGRKRSF